MPNFSCSDSQSLSPPSLLLSSPSTPGSFIVVFLVINVFLFHFSCFTAFLSLSCLERKFFCQEYELFSCRMLGLLLQVYIESKFHCRISFPFVMEWHSILVLGWKKCLIRLWSDSCIMWYCNFVSVTFNWLDHLLMCYHRQFPSIWICLDGDILVSYCKYFQPSTNLGYVGSVWIS